MNIGDLPIELKELIVETCVPHVVFINNYFNSFTHEFDIKTYTYKVINIFNGNCKLFIFYSYYSKISLKYIIFDAFDHSFSHGLSNCYKHIINTLTRELLFTYYLGMNNYYAKSKSKSIYKHLKYAYIRGFHLSYNICKKYNLYRFKRFKKIKKIIN